MELTYLEIYVSPSISTKVKGVKLTPNPKRFTKEATLLNQDLRLSSIINNQKSDTSADNSRGDPIIKCPLQSQFHALPPKLTK
jgi:hypothetical protein